jgi:aspartate racemase
VCRPQAHKTFNFESKVPMKTIGIIGGLGPESTLDYYREIISAFKSKDGNLAYPQIVLFSVNLNEFMTLIDEKNWTGLSRVLLEKINALHHAGAEFAAIASNTPHIVFQEVQSRSPIPLLSIVEAACDKARQMGVKRAGLMGTRLTMASDFYQKVFQSQGISIAVPSEKEQQFINRKLFTEIELGIFKDATRKALYEIAERMMAAESIDALILGCTELPLIMSEKIMSENRCDIPFLNTTAIHCERIVAYCIDPIVE